VLCNAKKENFTFFYCYYLNKDMNIADMSEFTSSVSSQTASWFEFLLNPMLLDTFLTEDNLGK
jgi:hypothetical protein